MTDEQAVREWLGKVWEGGRVRDATMALDSLALLDAKDAEIAELREQVADLPTIAWLDGAHRGKADLRTALSRAEQAEAALAEERKAHQAFREEVSAAIRIWKGANPHFYSHHLSRFILPAKPADPLEAVVNEAWGWRNPHPDVTANLRAAIERAGGTISFEGEG